MTGVEIGILIVAAFTFILGYGLGFQSGKRAGDEQVAYEKRRRDQLAREIEEGIAAFHSRPQLHGVAEVVPFRRREHRDRIA